MRAPPKKLPPPIRRSQCTHGRFNECPICYANKVKRCDEYSEEGAGASALLALAVLVLAAIAFTYFFL